MRAIASAATAGVLGLALTAAAMQPAGAIETPDFTQIVKDNRDAVVNISTTQKVEGGGVPEGLLEQLPPGSPFREFFKRFGERGPQRERSSLGSGFIMSSDGFVLTAAHVIAKADQIVVKLADYREFEAEVVGFDERSDVGLLKVDAEGLPTLDIGDSDELEVGQWVLAIGSPFGLEHTATQGIVSALERSLPNDTYTPFIQTDVAVNPGNSGGPLFNGDGEVVGINAQIFSRTGGYMGLSFAVPIDVAMDVAEQLKATGKVRRGYLGVSIQPVDRGLAESFGLDKPVGALVADVLPDSPAEAAGLQPGDIILEFAGKRITEAADLPPVVGRTAVGSEAEVTVLREGERRSITVEVGELPDEAGADPRERGGEGGDKDAETSLNLGVRELTESERAELGLGERGLLVQKVGSGPAAEAGIRPGDILLRIGKQPLSTVDELRQAVAELPRGRPVAVQIRRGDNSLFVSLTLPEQ